MTTMIGMDLEMEAIMGIELKMWPVGGGLWREPHEHAETTSIQQSPRAPLTMNKQDRQLKKSRKKNDGKTCAP
jgi:hypothetical protein